MLFTITRDQYQKYGDAASQCRQYILDKYSNLCKVVDTFNRYFTPERVDIYGSYFKDKSLLLYFLECHELYGGSKTITEYLDFILHGIRGSDRVGAFEDLAIYVWWPEVTVTNERGQSVVVTDLYAKIPMYPNGRLCGRFQLTRATYPYDQFSSGYLHSHIPGINYDPSIFQNPCLGSGPLVRTQDTLSSYCDYEDLWDLFCVELDRYVHVESIAGVPYKYLDKIGTGGGRLSTVGYWGYRVPVLRPINTNTAMKELFTQFFKYVLVRKKMKFAFIDGMYISPYSNAQWLLKLSGVFLKYYAMMSSMGKTSVVLSALTHQNLLLEVKVNNGVLYNVNERIGGRTNHTAFCDRHVLYFKGEDIRSHVDDPVDVSENTYYVLNPVLGCAFLDQCLNYLNIYEHEKIKNVIQENNQDEIISTSDSGNRTDKNTFAGYPLGEKRVTISL